MTNTFIFLLSILFNIQEEAYISNVKHSHWEMNRQKEYEVYQRELACLTLVLHKEAQGEGLRGLQLVAEVILNRKRSNMFPDSVCSVVKQKGSFDGFDSKASKKRLETFKPKARGKYSDSFKIAQRALQDGYKSSMLPSNTYWFKVCSRNDEFFNSKLVMVKQWRSHCFFRRK